MFACEQTHYPAGLPSACQGAHWWLPALATCLTTDEVYQAFYDDYSTLRAIPAFTATPIHWPVQQRWQPWTYSNKTT
jgi:hypothetical protein